MHGRLDTHNIDHPVLEDSVNETLNEHTSIVLLC